MTLKMLECQKCSWFSSQSEDEDQIYNEYDEHCLDLHAPIPVLWEEGIDFDVEGAYL